MNRIESIVETCTACGACASVCPKGCIHMVEDINGFYYPKIDYSKCIDCGLCEKNCHILTPSERKHVEDNNSYMFWQGDTEKRQSSTSGGAFSLFAQYVLEKGGVVFGSYYNSKQERLEVGNTEKVDFELLKKSKYVESYVGTSLKSIKDYLKQGRYVLYCGTPCQAAGIRKYLTANRVNQEKLILIDFACHGVPTNKALTLFKRHFETQKKKVTNIEFRYKNFKDPKSPWHALTMKLYFSDNSTRIIRKNSYYYYYYKAFDISANLRYSCYNCHQVDYSFADITVGDFWDIYKYKPELDDNKGISFIKFHNNKWACVLDTIQKKSFIQKLPADILHDPYNKKTKLPKLPMREHYLDLIWKYGYFLGSIKFFGILHILNNTFISQIKELIKPVIYSTIWRNRKRY